MAAEMKVTVSIRVRPAFESETQIPMAPQPDTRSEAAQVIETRVVPISTSSISPGLSVSLDH